MVFYLYMPNQIEITDKARDHIRKLMVRDQKKASSLRVGVVGGGCSGFSYKMKFEQEPGEGDHVFDANGIRIFVDGRSSLFLKGLRIDFTDDLNGSGFAYENPNAKKSCGCGTSFSV